MPIKFKPAVTTKLFKFVRKVSISFNPLDVRSTSAKEVMRQVSATRFLLANPKIVIEKNLNLSPRPPSVVFTFIDGSDEIFDTQDLIAKEMMDTIWLKTNAMSCEYEMEGKSIDDSM